MNNSREVLPGATASEILSVRMKDFAAQAACGQSSPEWDWVKKVACFEQSHPPEEGERGYIINVSETSFKGAPASLLGLLKRADDEGFVYVHFGDTPLTSPEEAHS